MIKLALVLSVSVVLAGCASTAYRPAVQGMSIAEYTATCGGEGPSFTQVGESVIVECANKPHEWSETDGSTITGVWSTAEYVPVLQARYCNDDSACEAEIAAIVLQSAVGKKKMADESADQSRRAIMRALFYTPPSGAEGATPLPNMPLVDWSYEPPERTNCSTYTMGNTLQTNCTTN